MIINKNAIFLKTILKTILKTKTSFQRIFFGFYTYGIFKLEEQMNFIKSDETKLIIKERPCETFWAIEEEIEKGNTAKIIDNNKDNATVQALIAWKQQVIKTKALRCAFEREYEFMEDKKWWALDENNIYYRYY